MRSGHNRAVDWWSLGALMYDMLTGAVGAHLKTACLLCLFHGSPEKAFQHGGDYICLLLEMRGQPPALGLACL